VRTVEAVRLKPGRRRSTVWLVCGQSASAKRSQPCDDDWARTGPRTGPVGRLLARVAHQRRALAYRVLRCISFSVCCMSSSSRMTRATLPPRMARSSLPASSLINAAVAGQANARHRASTDLESTNLDRRKQRRRMSANSSGGAPSPTSACHPRSRVRCGGPAQGRRR
jgi:hypothetical protein